MVDLEVIQYLKLPNRLYKPLARLDAKVTRKLKKVEKRFPVVSQALNSTTRAIGRGMRS